jgi:hypothetical protein
VTHSPITFRIERISSPTSPVAETPKFRLLTRKFGRDGRKFDVVDTGLCDIVTETRIDRPTSVTVNAPARCSGNAYPTDLPTVSHTRTHLAVNSTLTDTTISKSSTRSLMSWVPNILSAAKPVSHTCVTHLQRESSTTTWTNPALFCIDQTHGRPPILPVTLRVPPLRLLVTVTLTSLAADGQELKQTNKHTPLD